MSGEEALAIIAKCLEDAKKKEDEVKFLKEELEKEKGFRKETARKFEWTLKAKDSKIQELHGIMRSNYFHSKNENLQQKVATLEEKLKEAEATIEHQRSPRFLELALAQPHGPSPVLQGLALVLEKTRISELEEQVESLKEQLEKSEIMVERYVRLDRQLHGQIFDLKARILELNPDEKEPEPVYNTPEERELGEQLKAKTEQVLGLAKSILRKQEALIKKKKEEKRLEEKRIRHEERRKRREEEEARRRLEEEEEEDEDEEDEEEYEDEEDCSDEEDEDEEDEDNEDSDGWNQVDAESDEEEKEEKEEKEENN